MSASATHAEKLVDYLNASWTPYHATANARAKLLAAGYTELYENDVWNLKLGGRYFFTRNMSCLVAFAVGGKYKAGNGAIIVGAHTDSPCIKMKPHTASGKNGFVQLGVQPYGGGIWYTWFDRDLSVAGRVFVRRGDRTCHELVRIDRPIMCIPSLAIHLNRTVNKGFDVNCQTHLPPILATEVKSRLEMPVTAEDEKKASGGDSPDASALRHSPLLLKLLAEELKCKPEDILTFDLQLCDTQPSTIGGACREFIHSGRLDNLAMCYCATEGLIETDHSLADETGIRMVALYDHEEVGSGSAYGARSPITIDVLRRVTRASCEATGENGTDALERCVVNSFLVSADMAHGIHPNFADKHEPGHQPHMHKGMVIKTHCEMRYITDAFSQHVFHECGRRAGVPFQQFVVRSDCPCGSTIGPHISIMAGVRGIDVGKSISNQLWSTRDQSLTPLNHLITKQRTLNRNPAICHAQRARDVCGGRCELCRRAHDGCI